MQLTFLSAEHPANPFQSRALEPDWLTPVVISCLPILPLLHAVAPNGWFGRMSPAYCHPTEDGTLAPSSGGWQNSGMGSPTECWTLSSSEHAALNMPFLNGGGVCSLSDILETGDLPQRYYLTAKACAGILRRAEKRGKELPEALHQALVAVVK